MRWLALLTFVLAACGSSPPGSPAPPGLASPLPSRPAVPPGWSVVAAAGGGLRLALPPDIIAFDTSGPIFANQPPPSSGGEWIQLLAEGLSDQQPAAGEPLDQWLERRWLADEPARGPTTERSLLLPAGPAVELRTSLEPGTGMNGS